MNNLNPLELLNKYLEGTTTPEEDAMLESWYMRYQDQSLTEVNGQTRVDQLAKIRAALVAKSDPLNAEDEQLPVISGKTTRLLWPLRKIAVAAAVMIIGYSAGMLYYSNYAVNDHRPEFTKDIAPGKNGAMLTLANGKQIYISDAAAGNIAEEAGVSISKTADGQITYRVKAGETGRTQYNTLQTRNGQQTQIILPDHSKVWLNAGSIIKYPSSFAALKDRNIELTGEAYFEVAKDKNHPFIVKTALQEVQVLGTHFNINSYSDEPKLITTLLEGSVKVNYGKYDLMLKPGQQSVLKLNQAATITPSDMKINQADIAEAMAWKNGFFRFEEEPLESVMRKVARWYNVEVTYAPGVPKNILLGGFISRSKNISAVLEMMTRTEDVRFKMEGNKVTVLKYK